MYVLCVVCMCVQVYGVHACGVCYVCVCVVQCTCTYM